ncbi:MAG: OsmC family protein, partial [Candidatus Korarchaeota archaeon]|nr:OsmC family protein [Candidatus Korarchaeota archaeon]
PGIVVDGKGRLGPSPMQLVLMGVAGCTAVDVAEILGRNGQVFERLEVVAEAERAPEPPRVFTRVKIRYVVHGDVDENILRDAIKLSQARYCSASIMVKRSGAEVTTEYEIVRGREN